MDDTGNSEPPPLTQQIYQQAQPMQITPQYTLTLDGQTIKANQIQYKLEPAIQMDDSLHDIQSYSTQQVTYSKWVVFIAAAAVNSTKYKKRGWGYLVTFLIYLNFT